MKQLILSKNKEKTREKPLKQELELSGNRLTPPEGFILVYNKRGEEMKWNQEENVFIVEIKP